MIDYLVTLFSRNVRDFKLKNYLRNFEELILNIKDDVETTTNKCHGSPT